MAERKEHTFVNGNPGFRCSECRLGWWGDSNVKFLPECGSKEALDLAEWQLTEGVRRDEENRKKYENDNRKRYEENG